MRMRSHCTGHFPGIRFAGGRRMLWQPVAAKTLADRPEERVRLRSIDYLLKCGVWPSGHIATEKGDSTKGRIRAGRVDVLLYDASLQPAVLIECKAPAVVLNAAAARQIARYNADLGASVLCITNGFVDHWYEIADGASAAIDTRPVTLRPKTAFVPDAGYWHSCGFVGPRAAGYGTLLQLMGTWFGGEAANNLICLNPGLGGTAAGFPHYYHVVQEKDSPVKLAFTVASTDGLDSVLVLIRNVNGRNEAVLFLPLDAVYLGHEASYRLIRSSADSEHLLPDHLSSYLLDPDDAFMRLPVMLDDLFTL